MNHINGIFMMVIRAQESSIIFSLIEHLALSHRQWVNVLLLFTPKHINHSWQLCVEQSISLCLWVAHRVISE